MIKKYNKRVVETPEPDELTPLREELKRCRKAAKLSIPKASSLSGISANRISYIESGKEHHDISIEAVLRLCKAYKVVPGDVFGACGM